MAVHALGIVGSGIMGSGIAECAALHGFEVVLRSRSQSTADATLAGIEKSLAKQVEKGTHPGGGPRLRAEQGHRHLGPGRARRV